MTYLPSQAEIAFEREKDDGRVQAILKGLGDQRQYVSDWAITVTRNKTTYHVALIDGSELRGELMFAPRRDEWIAIGTHIPKEAAGLERFFSQKPD